MGTVRCGEPAAVAVYWPGHAEPIFMCRPCAERAAAVARAMGFGLATSEPIVAGVPCQSWVRELEDYAHA